MPCVSFCTDLSFDATTSKSSAFGIICTLSFVLCSISAVEFNQSATVHLDFCLKYLLQGACTYCGIRTQWSSDVNSKNTIE